jgi:hypothetical protein
MEQIYSILRDHNETLILHSRILAKLFQIISLMYSSISTIIAIYHENMLPRTLRGRASIASWEEYPMSLTGLVRLRVRQGGKRRLYEYFDPTNQALAQADSPLEGAAPTGRQLGGCLLGKGQVDAFEVLPPRRTDPLAIADVIFLGHRGR